MLSNDALIRKPGTRLSPETKQMLMKMRDVTVNNDILSTRDHLDGNYHYSPQNNLVIDNFNFNDFRVRSYMRKNIVNQESPALMYLHGGGFVGGTLDSLDAVCRIFADQAHIKVYSLDYHLAPENPFPAALMDSYNFLLNLYKYSDIFKVDRNQLFMAGDSAGGNLTITTALLDSDAYFGTHFLQKIVAFYPPVSCATEGKKEFWNPSEFQTVDQETQTLVSKYIHNFLRHSANYDPWYAGSNSHNPLVSPIYASDEQLETMPPTKIMIGEFDGLRILTQKFAERLMKINSNARFEVYTGMVHAFLNNPQIFPEAKLAITDAIQFFEV